VTGIWFSEFQNYNATDKSTKAGTPEGFEGKSWHKLFLVDVQFQAVTNCCWRAEFDRKTRPRSLLVLMGYATI